MNTVHKVAVVTPVFPPYRGGIGTVAYYQAQLLGERGLEVTVLTPDYNGERGHPALESGKDRAFKLRLLEPVLKYGNAAWLPKLKELVQPYDAVLLHYPFFGGAGAVYYAAKKYGFRLAVFYHMDTVGSGLKRAIFSYNARYFLPRLAARADVIMVSSEDYARHSSIAPSWDRFAAKFHEVPNGVDTSFFQPSIDRESALPEWGILEHEPCVLFVGGLDKAHYFKGVDYLIRSIPFFKNAGAHTVIVGSGDLASMYQQLARDLKVETRVSFAGSVANNDLVRLYGRASVTVLPSIDKSEAFGIVLVESMACATPVIASDLPGVRSVFTSGATGFAVPPKDPQALAERIDYLLERPDLVTRMGAAARERAVQLYDWQKIGDKLFDLITIQF